MKKHREKSKAGGNKEVTKQSTIPPPPPTLWIIGHSDWVATWFMCPFRGESGMCVWWCEDVECCYGKCPIRL